MAERRMCVCLKLMSDFLQGKQGAWGAMRTKERGAGVGELSLTVCRHPRGSITFVCRSAQVERGETPHGL